MKMILMLLGLLIISPMLLAETGVAYIHGSRHHPDAINDYWSPEFIYSVNQGLTNPNNFVVVGCDFNYAMWDDLATGCLVDQLTDFITTKRIDNLVIIAHSHGGNMIRWILSNPTWDPRYPAIVNVTSRVIAIAPSSGGSPLADAAFYGITHRISRVFNYNSDAIAQQQTSWMAYYNQYWLHGTENRPAISKPFDVIVGSDVKIKVWDSNSYCGGYSGQVGLKITQRWLGACSDGVVNCNSQKAAGTVWFTDTEKTEGQATLSHNQSRHACFNIDILIRESLQAMKRS